LLTISGVMSMPTARPSIPTWAAATKESNPAPEPTSMTRSPGSSRRSEKGLLTPAKDSTARSGSASDHVRVVAKPGREGPAGVEAEGVSGVERDGAVLVADLAADRVAIGTCLFTHAASPRRKW
jgi:hypothetical protein